MLLKLGAQAKAFRDGIPVCIAINIGLRCGVSRVGRHAIQACFSLYHGHHDRRSARMPRIGAISSCTLCQRCSRTTVSDQWVMLQHNTPADLPDHNIILSGMLQCMCPYTLTCSEKPAKCVCLRQDARSGAEKRYCPAQVLMAAVLCSWRCSL